MTPTCPKIRRPGGNFWLWGNNPYIKYIAFGLVASFLVWFTPHTLVLTNEELKALGGPYHKYLGPLGIMPAKNTAVNYMIILTALSFLIYRRANKIPTVSWVKIGNTWPCRGTGLRIRPGPRSARQAANT